MSASYQAILWNRQKKIYDWIIAAFVFFYLIAFILLNLWVHPDITEETLLIRATSTLALLLLHVILCIGPLARLHPFFLPMLYNRRHLGVTMFTVAAVHGIFSVIQFHSLGSVSPILSVFISNTHYESFSKFPFQTLGFVALVILFLMAATSHDFWLHNLGARVWKTLHMMVYVAYALIVMHVLLGVVQYETSPVLVTMLGVGVTVVTALHSLSGRKEFILDRKISSLEQNGFIEVCSVNEIPESRAKVVCLDEERIAIFKYDNKLSAVSNVCKHQNGPLGEGRVIDGCITCPWHGYQYLPHNGSSPPPFKEKVSTYDIIIINKSVWVNPRPYAEGTERPAALIDA